MKKIKIIVSLLLISIFAMLPFSGCSLFDSSGYIEKTLAETEGGIRNPLMGFRLPFFDAENYNEGITDNDYISILKDRPYGTLSREYINWIDLEYDINSDFNYFLAESESKLRQTEKFNVKVTPRVILNWPNQNDTYNGIYWPVDMNDYDYDSIQFKERLASMILKMAKAWDNDPRIAYIEMGIFGQWGEQHSPSPSIEMQEYTAGLFNTYFKNKKIMVRYPTSNLYQTNENFGLYWDEWGSNTQYDSWDQINLVETEEYKDKWKTSVFGGETTFNQAFDPNLGGGRFQTFGFTTPFTSEQAFTTGLPEIIKYLGLTHTNHVDMVMVPSYNGLSKEAQAGFDAVQSFMGYKMVIGNIKYKKNITDQKLEIELDITNKGASPFYYDWNVAVNLLDSNTKKPVYTEIFTDISTMDFMPGENWNIQNAKFDIKPVTHKLTQTFTVPENIAKGKYILAVTMLDPAGMVPAACFANISVINGGYTALGYIGVDRNVLFSDYSKKDDHLKDTSIRYYQNLGLYADTQNTEVTDGLSNTAYIAVEGENSIIAEFENACNIMSAETIWNEMPDYELWISQDGTNWEKGRDEIKAKNGTGRNFINRTNIKFVKIVFNKSLAQNISLYTFNIYGE